MSETSPKLRAELVGIPTYKPGRPAAAGGPVAYKLSSNENPYPPLPGVLETVTAAAGACNRYPECDFTSDFHRDSEGQILLDSASAPETSDVMCNLCAKPMIIKKSRFWPLFGCIG